jgi:hypothetical protein
MNSTNATHLEDEGVFYATLRSIFLEISPIQLTNYLASLSVDARNIQKITDPS